MAQTVEYTLNLIIDGQDHVVNLSSDVKKLAEDLSVANNAGDELRNSLIKINNDNEALRQTQSG